MQDQNKIIELPNEMWCEILKHFDLEQREVLIQKREKYVQLQEKKLRQLQLNVAEHFQDWENIAYKVRPLCNLIHSEIDQLEHSVQNKLILMEPQMAAPMQNLQSYSIKLKSIMEEWFF